jgi:hypothetical protein
MPILRAGALAALVVLAALTAAAGPASGAAACRGSLAVELGNADLRVSGIRTTNMSCPSGKRLIRRFFRKADTRPRCRREAAKDPPTPGCSVGSFRCWRGLAKYCARRGQDVAWRERRV